MADATGGLEKWHRGGVNIDCLYSGILYIPLNSSMVLIDVKDGTIIGSIDSGTCGPPSLYNGRLYFSNGGMDPNYLHCYDLATQQTLWKTNISELGRFTENGNTILGYGGG